MASPAPDHLPLMPVGCWAVPVGIVGTALVVGQDGEGPGWWLLALGIVFALFALAYGDRALAERRRGGTGRGAIRRAAMSAALGALFMSLWWID